MYLITRLFSTNLHIFVTFIQEQKEFRELVDEVATLMAFEITRDLPLEEVDVETPVQVAKSNVISGKNSELCRF